MQFDKVIPFEDNSFDSVSMIELIEHLSDDEIASIFQQIHRVLKKGGKIYITTPNYLSLWPILEFILNKVSKVSYEDQHISKFNFLNINKIINNDKFNIIKKNSFIFLSPFTAFFHSDFQFFFRKLKGYC